MLRDTDHVDFIKDKNGKVLVPQPSNDPADPLNWRPLNKAGAITCAILLGFVQGELRVPDTVGAKLGWDSGSPADYGGHPPPHASARQGKNTSIYSWTMESLCRPVSGGVVQVSCSPYMYTDA